MGILCLISKKPLAFITGVICSTVCLHHCSALERNELGIITALTKDATIEKKIGEACLAYRVRGKTKYEIWTRGTFNVRTIWDCRI